MTRWEYKSYLFESGDKLLERLNSMGNEGWEAFHFMHLDAGQLRVFFKRQHPPEKPS